MKNIFRAVVLLIFCWNNAKAQTVYSQTITGIKQHLGAVATVSLTIDLAAGHSDIIKPLIVAEGFDVGVVFSPENANGINTYATFRETVRRSFNTELRDLIYEDNKQYDIIYVDWNNGIDFLQRNAYALEEAIKWVNAVKVGTEKNVVLGQSMGGVIARYALADMEQTGVDHQTRLFISHDAPQQGANIPVSLQYMYRHLNNQYIQSPVLLAGGEFVVPLVTDSQPVSTYLSLLDAPASKQLLSYLSTINYGNDNLAHTSFYNELKAKGVANSGGYPVNCTNIAISNGAECGVTQGFNAGDNLVNYNWNKGLTFAGDLLSMIYLPLGGVIAGQILDNDFFGVALTGLIPGKSKYSVEFNAKAIPYGSNNQIYKGRVSYSKKILWLGPTIVINITNVQKNQPLGILPLDTYGGGFYDTSVVSGALTVPNLYVRDKFSFISTTSALDIGKRNVVLQDVDYKKAYVGATPPFAPLNSPFINFTNAFERFNPNSSNKKHISFDERNGEWLARELNATAITTNCAFRCSNNQILGPDAVCATSIYSAPTAGLAYYNWTILGGANLATLSANGGATVSVNALPGASGIVTLALTMGDDTANNGTTGKCGNVIITKSIDLSSAAATPGIVIGPAQLNLNEVYAFTYSGLANTPTYRWFIYGGINDGNGPEGGAYITSYQLGGRLVNIDAGSIAGTLVIGVEAVNACGVVVDTVNMFVEVLNPMARFAAASTSSIITTFPNPLTASNELQVNVVKTKDTSTTATTATKVSAKSIDNQVKIYDLQGNLKYSGSFKTDNMSIKNLNVKQGNYILNVNTNAGEQLKTILIVK